MARLSPTSFSSWRWQAEKKERDKIIKTRQKIKTGASLKLIARTRCAPGVAALTDAHGEAADH